MMRLHRLVLLFALVPLCSLLWPEPARAGAIC
jgi:hypothetical protein